VQGAFAASGLVQLTATANSPDLNPIERVFAETTWRMVDMASDTTVILGQNQLKLMAGMVVVRTHPFVSFQNMHLQLLWSNLETHSSKPSPKHGQMSSNTRAVTISKIKKLLPATPRVFLGQFGCLWGCFLGCLGAPPHFPCVRVSPWVV